MKTMRNLDDLSNYIHMQNEFNRIAAPIVEAAKKKSRAFIGKKIVTQKGLAKPYAEAMHFDRDSIKVNPIKGMKWASVHLIYVTTSYGDVKVEISLSFSISPTSCTYKQQSFYFGKLEGDTLASINEDCKVSEMVLDFNAELEKIKNYRLMEIEMEKAKDKISVSSDAYRYVTFVD